MNTNLQAPARDPPPPPQEPRPAHQPQRLPSRAASELRCAACCHNNGGPTGADHSQPRPTHDRRKITAPASSHLAGAAPKTPTTRDDPTRGIRNGTPLRSVLPFPGGCLPSRTRPDHPAHQLTAEDPVPSAQIRPEDAKPGPTPTKSAAHRRGIHRNRGCPRRRHPGTDYYANSAT